MVRERIQPDKIPFPWRRMAIALVAAAFVTTACSGSAATPSTASVSASHPSNAPTTAADSSSTISSTAPSFQASARAEPTPIPIWTGLAERVPGAPGHCDHPSPCQFTAGTYRTYGRWAFLPGLTMDIPDGWKSTEQDAGEFNLINPDFPEGSGLFFWRDMIPVEPDGTHITTVPSTVAGITSWLRANHRLRISDPMEVVIGQGLATTTFVVDVAGGAVNKDHPCSELGAEATCFDILTDPAHWDGAWTVASIESCRYYLAAIGPDADRHLLIVAVVTLTSERLRFERAVAPILDSLDVSRVTFN